MGTVKSFPPGRRCPEETADAEEGQILSKKHQEILKIRIDNLIKSITDQDITEISREVPQKLKEIHSSKEFILQLEQRVKLLYDLLFDWDFPKSRALEKTIAAGLFYFVSPADFLPDNIPGLGYLDDAFVIGEVWQKVSSDVKRYLRLKDLDLNTYI